MRQVAKFVVLQMLRGYKWAISPMIPPSCRFVPTCSEYAMEAVERYGAVRGGLMALGRLLRCHPLSRGGYDPVLPQGLKPALGTGDLSQCCAIQNHSRTQNLSQSECESSSLNGAALTRSAI
ncbi:MAG: membrane protein insertion efficiency factor YidD [Candidatus Sulfotelmatobacter sp.]|jgi:hypothetical protein